jgi:hypothetical protein
MAAAKRAASVAILADLAVMLDLARDLARDLPASDDPSQTELLEALALAHLCAERLRIERTRKRARLTRRR